MTRTRTGAALTALAIISLIPGLALAQAAAPAAVGVDFAPLVNGVILPVTQQVLIAAALTGLAWLTKHLVGLQLDDRAKASLTSAVTAGVQAVTAKISPTIKDGTLTLSTHSALVDGVLTYVVSQVPTALTRLGLTDATAVRAYVESHVAGWLSDNSLVLEAPAQTSTATGTPTETAVNNAWVDQAVSTVLDRLTTVLATQQAAPTGAPVASAVATPVAPAA